MTKYYLNPGLVLKKEDKVIFNYDTTELIKFNDSGFKLLELLLNQELDENKVNQDEKEFIFKLEEKKIILKK